MPSIVELIGKKRAEAAKQEAASIEMVTVEERKRTIQYENDERERQKKESRLKDKANQVLSQSGIPKQFKEIETSLLGGQKHAVVIETDIHTDHSMHTYITLAWGIFDIKDNRIVPTRGIFFGGQLDYDCIRASVYVDEEASGGEYIDVSVGDKSLFGFGNEWQLKQNLITNAIAEAYLHPHHVDNKP